MPYADLLFSILKINIMKYTVIIALVATVIISNVSGDCSRFRTTADLDLKRFMGHWTVDGVVYTSFIDPNSHCTHVVFNNVSKVDQAPVYIDAKIEGKNTVTGHFFQEHITAAVPDLTDPKNWVVKARRDEFDFNVLETDYDNYALMSICKMVNGQEELQTILSAREHEPIPAEQVQLYLTRLQEEFGIDTGNYMAVIQGHDTCGGHEHHHHTQLFVHGHDGHTHDHDHDGHGHEH